VCKQELSKQGPNVLVSVLTRARACMHAWLLAGRAGARAGGAVSRGPEGEGGQGEGGAAAGEEASHFRISGAAGAHTWHQGVLCLSVNLRIKRLPCACFFWTTLAFKSPDIDSCPRVCGPTLLCRTPAVSYITCELGCSSKSLCCRTRICTAHVA